MKFLIINADDFGYSKIFNEKILNLIESNMISSTTVMANQINQNQQSQIEKLIELAKSHNISIGLHLEFSNNSFELETKKQFDKFISIFKFKPSHIDIHRYTDFEESVPFVHEFCKQNNLPCRNHNDDASGILTTKNEVFVGTEKSFEELQQWICNLNDNESYEVLFHPGSYDPNSKSVLNKDRKLDFENIKKINPFLLKNDIKLITYFDLAKIQ
ncbi:MAG: ChbG/HpnK family deacetylase [Candidatus Aenigmarchaeota archaeon]|nr:ChbG/HpnK family deacetylase [Candidatus Aenigmarchaeota archaeon]